MGTTATGQMHFKNCCLAEMPITGYTTNREQFSPRRGAYTLDHRCWDESTEYASLIHWLLKALLTGNQVD